MALPQNQASALSVAGTILPPDDQVSVQTEDFEQGGVAIQDASAGLMSHRWRCWVQGIDIRLQRDGAGEIVLFQQANVEAVSLAFDQNMRPHVAYMLSGGALFLRWYDTVIQQYVTTAFGNGRNPRLTLDDKRIEQVQASDVIFAYIRDSGLYYRQQRDRFAVERLLKSNLPDNTRLKNIGMGSNLRLHFELV
nr:MAG TPA: Tail fiber protein [Caudoviricetes sp.]